MHMRIKILRKKISKNIFNTFNDLSCFETDDRFFFSYFIMNKTYSIRGRKKKRKESEWQKPSHRQGINSYC